MRQFVFLFIWSLSLHSCIFVDQHPFCPNLQDIIDSFIINHPNGDVVMLHIDRKENYDLLFIQNYYGYSQEDLDGYWVYKSKLVTYYQSDSIDRSSLVNLKMLAKYDGPIEGYDDIYEVTNIFEPSGEVYLINDNDVLINLNEESAPKLKFKVITQYNVIENKSLNEFINNYIDNTRDVLYELKFYIQSGKQYVSFRGMHYYDKEKYDGYFYRNGYPIVVYGIEKAKNIINSDSIEKPIGGIPNRKHHLLRDKFKTYPFPSVFEIRPNGILIPAKDAFLIIRKDE